MSGGELAREIDNLGYKIFGWDVDIDYELDGELHKVSAQKARKKDPLEDKEISELVFDTLCLVHSYDWYMNGDTSEEQYHSDINVFKDKWLKRTGEGRIKDEIEKSLAEARAQLYRDLLNQSEG